jgi:hypothetical protein
LLQVRFKESEIMIITNQSKKRDCKTISQYIRQLIINDIKNEGVDLFGMPQIQRRR